MSRFFEKFSLYELVVTAVMAALGIAIKPLVVPLAHIVCGPLMIPSGALAGGLYMMWLVIGYGLVRKPGTALIISIIQALLVIFTGVIGSHGIMSLATYIAPGLAVEVVMLVAGIGRSGSRQGDTGSRHGGSAARSDVLVRKNNAACRHGIGVVSCAIASMFANMAGTACVNVIFFKAPGLYLVLILSISAISGLIGGVIGWKLVEVFDSFGAKRGGVKRDTSKQNGTKQNEVRQDVGKQYEGEATNGWCDDVDAVVEGTEVAVQNEAAGGSGDEGLADSRRDSNKSSRKGAKIVAVFAVCLALVCGISLFLYSGESDSAKSGGSDAEISVMINGELQATFSMGDIMKMDAHEEYVDLSSASKKDAKGTFKGVLLSDLLAEAGNDSVAASSKDKGVDSATSQYSAALLTAGDGYSAAADMDEVSEVLIAYELDGTALGNFEKDGTGPLRAVFFKDTYGNRSVMNVVKVDLQKK